MFLTMNSLTFFDVDSTCMWWCGALKSMWVLLESIFIVEGFFINEEKKLICNVSLKICQSFFGVSVRKWTMWFSGCDSVVFSDCFLSWRGRRWGADHLMQPETGKIWASFCSSEVWGLLIFWVLFSSWDAAFHTSEWHIDRALSFEMPWY